MANPTTAFICCATDGYYYDCAKALGKSLMEHVTFDSARFHILPARVGPWPMSTITRPAAMLENWDAIEMIGADYVYCIDADMLVVSALDESILGEIVATEHPGYVGHHRSTLPYDRNELSRAYVPMSEGDRYYAGGFFGGEREAVRDMVEQMAWIVEGPRPRWEDESALNRCLLDSPPTVVLSPAYVHPEDDSYYRREVWKEDYPRIITALDKPDSERQGR